MPGKSKIEKLPSELIEQVESRILNNEDHGVTATWLQSLGHDITPENVYRHALKLREQPPGIREIRAKLERTGIIPQCGNDELQRLLIRLGAIRLQERYLIARILGAEKTS